MKNSHLLPTNYLSIDSNVNCFFVTHSETKFRPSSMFFGYPAVKYSSIIIFRKLNHGLVLVLRFNISLNLLLICEADLTNELVPPSSLLILSMVAGLDPPSPIKIEQ